MTRVQYKNIHFPRQVSLIQRLRFISFLINDVTLSISFITLLLWITNLAGVRDYLTQAKILYPFTPFLFILAGIPLFFGAKNHLIDTHHDAKQDPRPWWMLGIPIAIAMTIAVLGGINAANITTIGLLSVIHTSPFAGICFLLIGFALIPPYTRIPHRFHITQLLVFIVCALNVLVILSYVYQLFSPLLMQNIFEVSLPAACAFVFFSSGILLRWSNRGFLGNFTLASTASIFALRIALLNLFMIPVTAFLVLSVMRATHYNMYVVLSVIVIVLAVVSSLLLWMNIRILYSHELEHLLMRESLQFHNIDLVKEKEKLERRMELLEGEKQQYADKLTSKNAWQEAVERMG